MKFVVSGGGTLGPVTPLLAIIEEIKSRGTHEFTWIGTYGGPEKILVEQAGIPFIAIPAGRWRRYFTLRNLVDPFRVLFGFVRAYFLLKKLQPDCVLTAGAFVAVPVAYAAGMLKIPVLVHQQDVTWGLANKLMVRYATWVTVNFPISLRTAPLSVRKQVILTGNPVRSFIKNSFKDISPRELLLQKFHLEEGVPIVLVLGGGTGAFHLNTLVADAAKTLTRDVQIIHVTGQGKAVPTEGLANNNRYHHFEFFTTEMRDALALADVVISRAGLATISELALLGKPTMLMPIHNSHQEENADYLSKEGAIIRLHEEKLDGELLAKAIMGFVADTDRQQLVGARLKKLSNPDAAKEITDLVLKR